MKKNILFIYRGQVLLKEFLPEYEKYSDENCTLLVEKGIPFSIVSKDINKRGLNVKLMTHDDLLNGKINMMFDVIIGNPPYSRGLHLKIIKKAFDLLNDGGMMSVIHPASFALGKNSEPNKNYKDVIDIVEKYESTLTLFNAKSRFSNINFDGILSITEVTKVINKKIVVENKHIDDSNTYVTESVGNIYHHGSQIPVSIRKKIENQGNPTINQKSYKFIKNSPLWVKVNYIAGNLDSEGNKRDDYYCLFYKEYQDSLDDLISDDINTFNRNTGISVETHEEAINMLNYFKTKFCRFALSLNKIGTTIWTGKILDSVPYLDFTETWNDEKLYNYFNLNKDEINYIENFISKFYD